MRGDSVDTDNHFACIPSNTHQKIPRVVLCLCIEFADMQQAFETCYFDNCPHQMHLGKDGFRDLAHCQMRMAEDKSGSGLHSMPFEQPDRLQYDL